VVRTLEPVRRVRFALLYRDETPAPALRELIRAAEAKPVPPARAPLAALSSLA